MSDPAHGAVSAAELRTSFVLNPVSGRLRTRGGRRERLERFIARHRLNGTIATTLRAGHASELAREALERGAELVISVGGDGTMNEVARALVGTGACYGMIPCGSGNGLGRDLGLPTDFDQALEVLLDGAMREIDTGEVNGLPFFNVMGLGFDAEIGRRFNLSHRRGLLAYLKIGLQTFFSYRRQKVTIEAESRPPFEVSAFLAAVANSTQYGNQARIAPRARLDDGKLDLAVITTGSALAAVPLVLRLFGGSIDRSRWVRSCQAPAFRLLRAEPGPIHTDGEVHDTTAVLDIRVLPRSLRVLVPRGRLAGH